jgi:hypothetical protein
MLPYPPIFPGEREFLEAVRQHADIGYGRMLQIVSLEWFRVYGNGAITGGVCVSQLPPAEQHAFRMQAATDPLFHGDRT